MTPDEIAPLDDALLAELLAIDAASWRRAGSRS